MENSDKRYQRAIKQVKEQRDWYTHLIIFIIANITYQLFWLGIFDVGDFAQHAPWWARYTMPFFWGISVTIHYLYAFKPNLWKNNIFKRWEDKKIQEFMRKDEEEFNTRFRENIK